jgi:hypothetical protein
VRKDTSLGLDIFTGSTEMSKIKINVFENRFGDVELYPVKQKYQEKIRAHLGDFGVSRDSRCSAYLQGDSGEQFINELNPRTARKIRSGWSVNINVDAWEFLHNYGWDAHTLAETGELWKGGEL